MADLIAESLQLYRTLEADRFTPAIEARLEAIRKLGIKPEPMYCRPCLVPWMYWTAASRNSREEPIEQGRRRGDWAHLYSHWYAAKFWPDDVAAARTYGAELVWNYPSAGWDTARGPCETAQKCADAGKPECFGSGILFRMGKTWAAQSVPNMVSGHFLEACVLKLLGAAFGDQYWKGAFVHAPQIVRLNVDSEVTPGLIFGEILKRMAAEEGTQPQNAAWAAAKARWALDIVHRTIRRALAAVGWGHVTIWSDPTWAWQPSHDAAGGWCTARDTLPHYLEYLRAEVAALGCRQPPLYAGAHVVEAVGNSYRFLPPERIASDLDAARAAGVAGPLIWAASQFDAAGQPFVGYPEAIEALTAYKSKWEQTAMEEKLAAAFRKAFVELANQNRTQLIDRMIALLEPADREVIVRQRVQAALDAALA